MTAPDVFADALAAELATLTKQVTAPTSFGWGSDIACETSIDDRFTERAGTDIRVLFESATRRLITERGSLPDGGDPDDGDYGFNLASRLNTALTASAISTIEGQGRSEVLKDDRLSDATLTLTQSGTEWSASLTIVPVSSSESFSGTFAVSSANTGA